MLSAPRATAVPALSLSDSLREPAVGAAWIDNLVALGHCISRYAQRQPPATQLIVCISVPSREFAAALVACGWAMARPAPPPLVPISIMRRLEPGTPVRVVTREKVFVDRFIGLRDGQALCFEVEHRQMDYEVLAIAELPIVASRASKPRSSPGEIDRYLGWDKDWNSRLADAPDLAIIGTLAWLRRDLGSVVGFGGMPPTATLSDLLRPSDTRPADFATYMFPSTRMQRSDCTLKEILGVILDGASAIRLLGAIEAAIIVAVVDRSVADESPAEIVLQQRTTRASPLSLAQDIGWRPVLGVEALAFEVPL